MDSTSLSMRLCLCEMISKDHLEWRNTKDSLTKNITHAEYLNNPQKQAKCMMMAFYVIKAGSGHYNHKTISSEWQVPKVVRTWLRVLYISVFYV